MGRSGPVGVCRSEAPGGPNPIRVWVLDFVPGDSTGHDGNDHGMTSARRARPRQEAAERLSLTRRVSFL